MGRLARQATATLTAVSLLAEPGVAQGASVTTTPIQHVVVIFQENASFDHYFGTYPNAPDPAGEPAFNADVGTPMVNGYTPELLTRNQNLANPFRLDRSEPITCDMDHGYTAEQQAADGGLMDQFVQHTGATGGKCNPSQVMGYYDGNTVTALWRYAQRYAMSDNAYGTTFGPSTPGVLNLVSGQTGGAMPANVTDKKGTVLVDKGTVVDDLDPTYDDCSAGPTAALTGPNVGDLLNAKGITWGWFQGGFRPTGTANGKAVCGASSVNVGGAKVTDYSAHHEPFQYFQSTANPHHLPPTSVGKIGQTDQANHQYDLTDFAASLQAGNLPAVTFLKAKKYQDGHPGYSDPLDEQTFLVQAINSLEQSPFWSSTAIFIAYDDSDGWYDHVLGPIVNQSHTREDALLGPGSCGANPPAAGIEGRCGYGPRLPLLAISPYARQNFVDHAVSDQTSLLRFIEDNWRLGRIDGGSFDAMAGSLDGMFDFGGVPHAGVLLLDPASGEPVAAVAIDAAPLKPTQSGTLAGNSGGAFGYYRLDNPTGAALQLTLHLGPHAATAAHQVGLNAYQDGTTIGSITAQSTSLGDAITDGDPTLRLVPSATGGPVTVQVFNYSPDTVSYTLILETS